MALRARFKPDYWSPESGNSARRGRVPTAWRVLCGYPNCRGMLGHLFDSLSSADAAELILHAGYVQPAPNVWRLGRYAALQPDHMPRRPRFTMLSSSEHARRERDGEVILPDGRRLSQELAHQRALPAGMMRGPNVQCERVSFGTAITIECRRCHAPSQFVVRPSAAILEEVRRRARQPA